MANKEAKTSTDFTYGLWTLFLRTRQIMFRVREKELHKWGVTPRSSGVLLTVLTLGERATPARISELLHLEPHSISEQLKRMERDGLVRRVKDLERRNLIRVELTEKGQKAYQDSCGRESIDSMMAVLTHKEQLELWRLLSKLRAGAVELAGPRARQTELYPPSNPEELQIPRMPVQTKGAKLRGGKKG